MDRCSSYIYFVAFKTFPCHEQKNKYIYLRFSIDHILNARAGDSLLTGILQSLTSHSCVLLLENGRSIKYYNYRDTVADFAKK